MAIWRSSLKQTASNNAATIVAAEVGAGLLQEDVDERFHQLVADIFEELEAAAKQDDEAYEGKGDSEKPARKSSSKSSSSRSKKTGGGSRSKSSGKVTLEDALSMELSYGAFEGETLEAVLGFDADTCDSDYGYGDGERDGRDYIAWLASDKNKNDFTRRRAQLIAAEEDIDY